MQERLQKIIAHAGVSSRREAEAMIREGRVTLNGRVVEELGTRADPDRDHIKVDGKLITHAEPHRYILLYKPKEVMTTVEDPQGRRTVIDLVRGIRERIYPVGRLDFHSEGLVLLTNDGELAFKVSHPTHGSVKTYSVKVRGVPEERLVDKLRRGITIDGKRTLPCDIERMHTTGKRDDEGNSWFEVKLREGRTQQIRKMFQAVGHPVSKLRRVAIGPISDPKLTPGVWRELTKQEVKMLETMKELKKTVKPRRTTARPTSRKKPAAAAKRTPAASRPKPAAKRAAATRTPTRSSTRRTPSPRPATPRPKVAAGKSTGSKKPAVRRAGARPSRSSARR
ncbi:MAG TPA: pseudouridine synthase [Thermoanaerobaculia bacterium]|jgi:23S rRNA pseudouridine2605 synthase|nr:pseudouridine synthase [Thermoanaerobaculia bacterium]